MTHTIVLTDQQVETVKTALRMDYKETMMAFGALPVGQEMAEEIKDTYLTIVSQTSEHQET